MCLLGLLLSCFRCDIAALIDDNFLGVPVLNDVQDLRPVLLFPGFLLLIDARELLRTL